MTRSTDCAMTRRSGACGAVQAHEADLGYALLLKRYRPDVTTRPTRKSRRRPPIPCRMSAVVLELPLHGRLGLYFIALFGYGFYLASRRQLAKTAGSSSWRCVRCRCRGVLPSLADRAECGRQPWTIDGVLRPFCRSRRFRRAGLDFARRLRGALQYLVGDRCPVAG